METLDDFLHDLKRNPDSGGQFTDDCVHVFADTPGQRFLAALCRFRFPLFSPYQGMDGKDPVALAFKAGQHDVVSTLYRLSFPADGSGGFNPHDVKKDGQT